MSTDSPQLPLALETASADHELTSGPTAPLFRPIHYLGSKLRLAPVIAETLDIADRNRGVVLDLFAGSGTTALALARHRTVIASDIQEYSRVLCSALLKTPHQAADIFEIFQVAAERERSLRATLYDAVAPLIEYERSAIDLAAKGDAEPICAILEVGSLLAAELGMAIQGPSGLVAALRETVARMSRAGLAGSPVATAVRYFGGAYFSYEQAVELDWLAEVTRRSRRSLADVYTASLLSTASDAVNTVGKQFAQPIRPRAKNGRIKGHLLAKIIRDRSQDVISMHQKWLARYGKHRAPPGDHTVVRSDYRAALAQFAGRYSVVYADPPYTRDHYSRFYHVLETIALRDNPAIARSPGAPSHQLSRGMYRAERHQSPFCIKSQCNAAFDDLFRLTAAAKANLVVSYSPYNSETSARPRLMRVAELLAVASKYYAHVELESVNGIAHSKLNHSSLNFDAPEEAEVLLLCTLKS